jgi:cell division protein FtsL
MISLVLLTAIVLVNVGLRFKNEELVRLKSELLKIKSDQRTLKVKFIAEYQDLSTENRIVSIAERKLGMQKQDMPSVIIKVDKKLIDEVAKKLNSKYE